MNDDPHERRVEGVHSDECATCPHTGVKVGQRIRLTHMGDDHDPIPKGTKGTVTRVEERHSWGSTNTGQVGVNWDNGRTLSLVVPQDRFTILKEEN